MMNISGKQAVAAGVLAVLALPIGSIMAHTSDAEREKLLEIGKEALSRCVQGRWMGNPGYLTHQMMMGADPVYIAAESCGSFVDHFLFRCRQAGYQSEYCYRTLHDTVEDTLLTLGVFGED